MALFLASLGIYAVKGYMVASRTSEIGIRKALGATHWSIMGMVLREGMVLTAAGLIVGLLLALAAGASDQQPALRRPPRRSGQYRRDHGPARRRLASGRLHSRPPGREDRSHDRPSVRIDKDRRVARDCPNPAPMQDRTPATMPTAPGVPESTSGAS